MPDRVKVLRVPLWIHYSLMAAGVAVPGPPHDDGTPTRRIDVLCVVGNVNVDPLPRPLLKVARDTSTVDDEVDAPGLVETLNLKGRAWTNIAGLSVSRRVTTMLGSFAAMRFLWAATPTVTQDSLVVRSGGVTRRSSGSCRWPC